MKKISRRNFLLASGVVTIGAALAACGAVLLPVLLLPPLPHPLQPLPVRLLPQRQGAEYLVLER